MQSAPFNAERAKAHYNGQPEMRKLKPETQKKVLWLFAKTVEAGGELTYKDPLFPDLDLKTDFDFSLSNEQQPIVELDIEEKGVWKARLLIIKTIGNNDPHIYPQMYKDEDWGLHHVITWVQGATKEEPDVINPVQPHYDTVCGIVNSRIGDAWSRRKFPALKQ